MCKYKLKSCGDMAVVIDLGDAIDPKINEEVHYINTLINASNIDGFIESIPSYSSILVCYNPLVLSYKSLCHRLYEVIEDLVFEREILKEVIHIPVLYGGKIGLDIEYVAKHNNLSVDQVIALHSAPEYRIYMMGFKPGFVYLGGLNEALTTPRLQSPRYHVEAGSVGIAGNQTGIYPQDSPGGWQMIGHTCIPLLDWSLPDLTVMSAGQYIKFEAVSFNEYEAIKKEVEDGSYKLKISREKGAL